MTVLIVSVSPSGLTTNVFSCILFAPAQRLDVRGMGFWVIFPMEEENQHPKQDGIYPTPKCVVNTKKHNILCFFSETAPNSP
jgi:hypothetical protein